MQVDETSAEAKNLQLNEATAEVDGTKSCTASDETGKTKLEALKAEVDTLQLGAAALAGVNHVKLASVDKMQLDETSTAANNIQLDEAEAVEMKQDTAPVETAKNELGVEVDTMELGAAPTQVQLDAVKAEVDRMQLDRSLLDLIYKPRLNKVNRPPNAFMVFAREHRRALSLRNPDTPNKAISALLGECWRRIDAPSKRPYYDTARQLGELHHMLNPGYRYSPQLARLQKQEKKAARVALKQEELDDGMTNRKKRRSSSKKSIAAGPSAASTSSYGGVPNSSMHISSTTANGTDEAGTLPSQSLAEYVLQSFPVQEYRRDCSSNQQLFFYDSKEPIRQGKMIEEYPRDRSAASGAIFKAQEVQNPYPSVEALPPPIPFSDNVSSRFTVNIGAPYSSVSNDNDKEWPTSRMNAVPSRSEVTHVIPIHEDNSPAYIENTSMSDNISSSTSDLPPLEVNNVYLPANEALLGPVFADTDNYSVNNNAFFAREEDQTIGNQYTELQPMLGDRQRGENMYYEECACDECTAAYQMEYYEYCNSHVDFKNEYPMMYYQPRYGYEDPWYPPTYDSRSVNGSQQDYFLKPYSLPYHYKKHNRTSTYPPYPYYYYEDGVDSCYACQAQQQVIPGRRKFHDRSSWTETMHGAQSSQTREHLASAHIGLQHCGNSHSETEHGAQTSHTMEHLPATHIGYKHCSNSYSETEHGAQNSQTVEHLAATHIGHEHCSNNDSETEHGNQQVLSSSAIPGDVCKVPDMCQSIDIDCVKFEGAD